MLGKLIPVVLALGGLCAGMGAGLALRPSPEVAGPEEGHAAESTDSYVAAPKDGGEDDEAAHDYVKLNNQFVVPVVEDGRVVSLVVLSLSLEVELGQTAAIFEREPKIRDAFLQESAFAECALIEVTGSATETIRDPALSRRGRIDFSVSEGIVTLNGEVPGLGHKRLAGVLAWWVPGSRDVINGLAETPPEEDNDDEITDAVRIALEKDPFVNAGQVRVVTRDSVVTLRGQVPTDSERDMAEADAWYVFGVNGVINELEVRA